MSSLLRLLSYLACGCTLTLTGCGPEAQSVSAETIRTSQDLYEQGVTAFEEKRFIEAKAAFTMALEAGGGLNPDMIGDLFTKRAIALAELGEFDAAHADLDIADQGAPPAQVHAARGYVYLKQGKKAKAKAAYAKAREFNPAIEIPTEI